MNRSSAVEVIRKSLEAGSRTPCTWRDDRDAYIGEKSAELVEAVIDPVKVSISRVAIESTILSDFDDSACFAIARSGENWLVYSSERGAFALAYGKNPDTLSFHGFHSGDALAEWLG